MKGALLVVLLLAGAPLVAQTEAQADGWSVTRHGTANPLVSDCAVSVKDEAGAALSLWSGNTPRLTLHLAPALRDRLALADGALSLAFRPSGQPAVLIEGRLSDEGALFVFTHTFADTAQQARFLAAAGAGRLTVFHPQAGVIARFDTSGTAEAAAALTTCNTDLESPDND